MLGLILWSVIFQFYLAIAAEYNVTAEVGKTVLLNCSYNSNGYIWDQLSPTRQALYDKPRFEGVKSQTLTITIVNLKDKGKYRCYRKDQKSHDIFYLTVQARFNVTAELGKSLSLNCSQESSKGYDWFKIRRDKVKLLKDEKRFDGADTKTLNIPEVNEFDARGKYQCFRREQNTSDYFHITLQAPTTNVGKGKWGNWEQWSKTPCGGGLHTRTRKRNCTSHYTIQLLSDCPGYPLNGTHLQLNYTSGPCPVDARWTTWSVWGQCSATCGDNIKHRRTRTCIPPKHGGKECQGDSEETQDCRKDPCPVDGQWGGWYDWNSCSVSCGGGQQTRRRECNSPEPKHSGKECVGDSGETRACSTKPCPKWHGWEQWGTCSASCGYGKQTRTRICEQCKNPPRETECIRVQNNLCDGLPKETKNCNTTVCLGNLSHSLQLTCDLGHTYYRWEKPQSSQVYVKGSSQTLEIDSLQYHDAGNYSCRNYNKGDRHPIKVVVQGKPLVQTTPTKNVMTGDTTDLPCTSTAHPAVDTVWWTKDGARVSPTAGYHGGTVQQPSLTISNVQKIHSGKYACHARNVMGESSSTTNVIIRMWETWQQWTPCTALCGYGQTRRTRRCLECSSPNQNPCSSITDSNLCGNSTDQKECGLFSCTGNKSESIELTCDLGHDRLKWKKQPSTEYLSWSYRKYDNFNTKTLTIKNLEFSDRGTYTCGTYSYIYGYQALRNISIAVHGIPNVVTKEKYKVPFGGNVTLTCDVVAYPAVTELWWTKNGTKISSRYKGGSIQQPSLLIIVAEASDNGQFTCFARNEKGTNNSTSSVVAKRSPLADIPRDYYVVKLGEGITINCTIQNWVKASRTQLVRGEHLQHQGQSKAFDQITLTSTRKTDRGNYTCYVKSDFGSHSDSTYLKLVDAKIGTKDINQRTNVSATIKCQILDAQMVKWYHNGKLKRTVEQNDIKDREVIPFEIDHLTRHDRGTYQCESSYDDVVVKSNNITVFVHDVPYIEPTDAVVEYFENSNAFLPCNYDAYPPASELYWTKDNEKVTLEEDRINGSTINQPTLNIYNARIADSGEYACHVKNSMGPQKGMSIKLIVKQPEKIGNAIVSVGAGVGGGILILLFIVLAIFFVKKRSTKKPSGQQNNISLDSSKEGTNLVLISDTAGSKQKTVSAESVPSTSKDADNTYYNTFELLSLIKVDSLKDYITRKDVNNGLQNEYKEFARGKQFPTTIAGTKENAPKNRYKEIWPYDHSRVVLDSPQDYINANYIDGSDQEKCYIASQGPTDITLEDHWRMIWQTNVQAIVMLTNLIEGSKKKCFKYWPEGGTTVTYGNLTLTLMSEKERATYVTRQIEVEDKATTEKRLITQYHFTAWPDHGTPDALYLVLFHRHVRSCYTATTETPLLVHCSAGIGRTGTYIALDALFTEGVKSGTIDIIRYVKKMRQNRMNMVQTADQYVCLHYALLEDLSMKETAIQKDDFGRVWMTIQSNKTPKNQQKLNVEYKALEDKKKEHTNLSFETATSNANKNRDKSVVPADQHRVYLSSFPRGRNDYINAVIVSSYTKLNGYITTQLPLSDTQIDFWTMIIDQQSTTIVLLTENPSEEELVYGNVGTDLKCGHITIKHGRSSEEEQGAIKIQNIGISKKGDRNHDVVVYQTRIKDLPTADILCKLSSLIATRIDMSETPVTVVCSDGARVCGLFCLFDSVVSSMTTDQHADIYNQARILQLKRPQFFQDFREYRLCYEALNLYLEISNVYANV